MGPSAQEQFPAIAYTIVVTGDGAVNICHDLTVRCWHSGAVVNGVSRNVSHVGICYTGNVQPNSEQIEGLRRAIGWVEQQLGRRLTVEGHRSVYATACPGPTMDQWLPLVKGG